MEKSESYVFQSHRFNVIFKRQVGVWRGSVVKSSYHSYGRGGGDLGS